MHSGELDSLTACAKALQGFEQQHLLSALGAVQLIPENMHLMLALERLARVAVTLPMDTRERRRITRSDLIGLIVRCCGDLTNAPALGAFTEAVAFIGGSYTIFTASTDDLGVTLRQFLQALFLDREPLDDPEFLEASRDIMWAALIVSDEVARRAGVRRNTPPPPEERQKQLLFPETGLIEAVVFDPEELHALFAQVDLRPEVLDSLTLPQGQTSLLENESLLLRPLVRVDNKLVLTLPGQLLNAARHAIQKRTIERGHVDQLARLLHRAAISNVLHSAARLGAVYIDVTFPTLPLGDLSSEFTFQIDTDKLLYVLLLTDTLQGFDETQLFSSWVLPASMEQVSERMTTAVAHICQTEPTCCDVLCLLVTQGPLGWLDESFRPLFPHGLFGIVLSTHELDTISWLEYGDGLALWHFAQNLVRVRERGAVHLHTILDEWAFSKNAEHSDYTLGPLHPDPLVIPPGGAARLRGEVLQKWDIHGATLIGPTSGVEVTRVSPLGSAVYTLCGTSLPVTRLVEGLPVPIWIVGAVHDDEWDERLQALHHAIVGAIAFWVDELLPDLERILSPVSTEVHHVTLRVLLEPSDDWFNPPTASSEEVPFQVIVKAKQGVVDLFLWADARGLFFGPDNSGERLLLESLLHGLCGLLPGGSVDGLGPNGIRELVDRHAPLGPKKAASFRIVPGALKLDSRGIPPYREVQIRDDLNVKAEIGRYATETLNCPVGLIPADRCDHLILQIVDFLFKRLAREISTLRAEGLLEWLMEQCESIVRRREEIEVSATARLACARDRASEQQKLHQEISDQAQAAIACRFLIEYTAAQPPNGLRPMSKTVHDYLLALVSQIYDWGGTRDLLYFGLATPEIVVHPFGRVEVGTGPYNQVRQRYYDAFAGHALSYMEEIFADHWEPGVDTNGDLRTLLLAEGMSEQLADLIELMVSMLPIGDEITPGVVCMPLDRLVSELQAVLEWDESRIVQRLSELSLRPRLSFLNPVAHRRDQVYPWRFHRALSYLRRPLVERERNGSIELLWGSQHISALAPYLWTSFRTQRLKDVDEETTRLMGKAADKAGLEFNRSVAKVLSKNSRLRVILGFKKVKGLHMSTDVGDVDVLVIDSTTQRILAIECKRLARADSPKELRRELDGLFLGEKSRIRRHERRIQWIKDHWHLVLGELRLDPAIEWDLVPLMVVDEELFAPYLQAPPFPILAIRDLEEWLVKSSIGLAAGTPSRP